MGEYTTSTLNEVLPARPRPPLPDRDARDYVLQRLRKFLSVLTFQRSGGPEGNFAFKVPIQNIHIYQPDDVTNAKMPGFGIIPGQGVHEPFGLGPPEPLEDTFDLYGPGTALVHKSDYIERIGIECWGSKHAERRALIAGLNEVLRSNDSSYALRLKIPAYYDQVAELSLDETAYVDGDEVARNRRRGTLYVKMQVPELALANFNLMRPELITSRAEAGVEVLDGNVYPSLDC